MKNVKSVVLFILVCVFTNAIIAADLDAGTKDINKSFKVNSGQKLLLSLKLERILLLKDGTRMSL